MSGSSNKIAGSSQMQRIQGTMSNSGAEARLRGGFLTLLSSKGRAKRSEYLLGNLLFLAPLMVLFLFLIIGYRACGRPTVCALGMSPLFAAFLGFGAFVAWGNAVQRIRRFHDFGLPGWAALVSSPALPFCAFVYMTWDIYPDFIAPLAPPPIFWSEMFAAKMFTLGLMLVLFVAPVFLPSSKAGRRYATASLEEQGY